MRIGHVHVAKLTPAQQALVADEGPWARACRDVWNAALQERLEALRVARGRTMPKGWWPTYASQCRGLTEAKQVAPWLAEAPHHVLQQTLKDLDTAWGAWLYERRAGRPRFRARKRSARNWWAPSYRFPDRKQFTIRRLNRRWGDATLPKIGTVRFRWDRDLPDDAQVTNVTLKRDRVGTWTVAFALDIPDVEVAHPNPGTEVGVDRGVTVLAATSDGQLLDRELLEPDRDPERRKLGDDLLTNGERTRLSRLERRKARQQRGSKNQARQPPDRQTATAAGPPPHRPGPQDLRPPGCRLRDRRRRTARRGCDDGVRTRHRRTARHEGGAETGAEPRDRVEGLGVQHPPAGLQDRPCRWPACRGRRCLHVTDLPCLWAHRPCVAREPSAMGLCRLQPPVPRGCERRDQRPDQSRPGWPGTA